MSKRLKADLALLFVVIIWGSTFAVMKDAFNSITPSYFLTLRFIIATLFLMVTFYKKLFKINLRILAKGFLVGIFLYGGYAFQVIGLELTDASRAGFITGLTVVLVPVLSAIILKNYLVL